MAAGNDITAYLVLHLSKEVPGLDVWRNNRMDAMVPGAGGKMRRVSAGIDGQADLTGTYAPSGRRTEIEVKGPGDVQRPSQRDFQHRVESHGGLYMICKVKHPATMAAIRLNLATRSAAHPEEINIFFSELTKRINTA